LTKSLEEVKEYLKSFTFSEADNNSLFPVD